MSLRDQFEEDCSGRAFTYYPPDEKTDEKESTNKKEKIKETTQSAKDSSKTND